MANNFPNSKTVERLRKRYPEGCRVKLIQMDDMISRRRRRGHAEL